METEKETPYYDKMNKIDSEYIKKYIGKNCYICFKKPIFLKFLSSTSLITIEAVIQSYDGYFLNVSIPLKKKNYSGIFDISNIIGIVAEESST